MGTVMVLILLLPVLAMAVQFDLPQTRQMTCYKISSYILYCAPMEQDEDIQEDEGWLNPRFTDNGDGTVTDHLTGLMWLQDANCIATHYSDLDRDGMVLWKKALDFAAGIDNGTYSKCGAGYTDWRLPNASELESLFNTENSRTVSWLNRQGFTNVQAKNYWTPTSCTHRTDDARIIFMWDSKMDVFVTTCYVYIWPVRAGSLGHSDLSVVKTDSPDLVTVEKNIIYTVTVTNNGPR